MGILRIILITVGWFAMLPCAWSQQQQEVAHVDDQILQHSHLVVRNILVSGNKKTKRYIVAREITFAKDSSYSISDILRGIQTSRQNLMNTALFVDAAVNFTNWKNDSLDIYADVKERWYVFPLPYLKPVDRNLNVWLRDYNLSLDRVNYGMKLIVQNVTGRNDRLNAWLIGGYTERFALRYYNPFSDNSLRHGWGIDLSYSRNREINYTTINNRQVFYNDPSRFLRKQYYFGGLYSYRKGSVVRHYVRAGIQGEEVADTIVKMNSNYLGGGQKQVAYPEIRYTYQYFDLNYIPYPTRGSSVEIDLLRRGFGGKTDLTQLQVRYGQYFPLPKKFYVALSAEANLKLPFDQPFFNQQYLGYNESFLRGMEYYVVDGVAGGFLRNTVGKELLKYELNTGLKSKAYGKIPFRIFLKGFADAGYVYNKNNTKVNSLNNKFLYTGGVGIDIVTIYDVVLRFEYSINQRGESGLFIHRGEVRN